MKKTSETLQSGLAIATILVGSHMMYAQVAPYTKAATLVSGSWPSFNNKGTMVWSQIDTNGYWQVWMTLQNSPFSSTSQQVTSGGQNHERPAIDDSGDIIYFQDGTGEGAGWEVVLLKNGVQSTLEFSSANPRWCNAGWHRLGCLRRSTSARSWVTRTSGHYL